MKMIDDMFIKTKKIKSRIGFFYRANYSPTKSLVPPARFQNTHPDPDPDPDP